jgi:murein DD-endopeptidase
VSGTFAPRPTRALGVLAVLLAAGVCTGAARADGAAPSRQIPPDYQLPPPENIEYRLAHATLRLFARAFAQGELVYLELLPDAPSVFPASDPVCRFGDYRIHLTRRPWGYRGFFPVPADSKPGQASLTVAYPLPDTMLTQRFALPVRATPFAVSYEPLEVGRFSDVHHARDPAVRRFIAECSAKKKRAFAHSGPDLITGRLAHPRDLHQVTSSFWSSRVYERFEMKDGRRVALAPERKIHRGVDLRGARGDPVFAIADGEVVLADSTYYEGNFTVIDHGNRVMSYYMHQDALLVKQGQRVHAGDRIGTVGSTGVSTAPHLHVSLMIDRVQVDPLSLLPLPVRD